MENKKSKRIFKVIMAAMSLALVAVISYGATLALMSSKTDEKVNTFTSSESVKIALDEPNWKGDEEVVTYTPDKEIPKDPTVILDETSAASYIAVKVEFCVATDEENTYKNISYNEFKTIASLEGFSNEWTTLILSENNKNGLIVYYGKDGKLTKLEQDSTETEDVKENNTPAVFTGVKFKNQETLQTSELGVYDKESNTYKEVQVNVTAYAVDATGLTETSISQEDVAEKSAQEILNSIISLKTTETD